MAKPITYIDLRPQLLGRCDLVNSLCYLLVSFTTEITVRWVAPWRALMLCLMSYQGTLKCGCKLINHIGIVFTWDYLFWAHITAAFGNSNQTSHYLLILLITAHCFSQNCLQYKWTCKDLEKITAFFILQVGKGSTTLPEFRLNPKSVCTTPTDLF